MAILQIFTTYLYAMLYGEPEHAAPIKCLDDIYMKLNQFYLSVFTRKPLAMTFAFVVCTFITNSLVGNLV